MLIKTQNRLAKRALGLSHQFKMEFDPIAQDQLED
jgi:hypothetical protein